MTFTAIVATVQFIIGALLFMEFIFVDILPLKYLIIYGIFVVGFFVAVMFSTRKKKLSVVFTVLSLLLAVGMGWGIKTLMKLDSTVQTAAVEDSGSTEATVLVDVVVLSDDEAEEVSDLVGSNVGYISEDSYSESALAMLRAELTSDVSSTSYDSMTGEALALINGTERVIVIEDSYLSILGEMDDFSVLESGTKVITSYEVAETDDSSSYDTNQAIQSGDDSFVMYISGVDTYGSVSTKSRSDVNILLVVNRSTGKILMINTPRDSYVTLPLGGGSSDKLTHAGLYGVDVSMATLESLYGVDIDYYLRVNFTGFEEIIDALGGITVYSDYSFTTTKGGYSIYKGENTMDGATALSFARERKAFSDGDIQRGKNQMKVISAVISKMQSASMLANFDTLMDEVSESFQTSMSSDLIYEIVKEQIASGTSWDIETYSVTGTNGSAYTYTISNMKSSVIYLDDSAVLEATEKIKEVLGL